MTTITLALEKEAKFEVDAEIVTGGEWAVHPWMRSTKTDKVMRADPGGKYMITYLPNGYGACLTLTKPAALKLARKLRDVFKAEGFTPIDLMNMAKDDPRRKAMMPKLVEIIKGNGGLIVPD